MASRTRLEGFKAEISPKSSIHTTVDNVISVLHWPGAGVVTGEQCPLIVMAAAINTVNIANHTTSTFCDHKLHVLEQKILFEIT